MKFIFTNYSNLFSLEIQDFSVLYCTFVPIMVYSNADENKLQILLDNKGKTGIYQWTHLESGKIYIGSAVNLSLRFRDYYNKGFLTRSNNSYIYNALLSHGYSAFSLTIYEYIDIQYLPKDEARKLILEREQLYIDTLRPNYNLLKTAGSSLGFKHTESNKAKLSEINKGENHPMFGRSHTEETKALMKANHSRGMLGRIHSPRTKALMSKTRTGINHPNFGKFKTIFVYSLDPVSNEKTLHKIFYNPLEAAQYFNCTRRTISRYLDKNALYKKLWVLSTS
jgi:group I intron endonuclease